MSIQTIEKRGSKVLLTLEIDLDNTSMLKSELSIEKALNEVGVAVGELALSNFDTDGRPIELSGQVLTSKGQQKKSTKDRMVF